MARVLFIIHDVYQNDNQFPLGPAYLASVLRKNGHEVQIYTQDVFHQTNEELALFLDSNTFDVIGLGFLAARYAETIRPLAKVINEHKRNAIFILGGQGASAIPEYMLQDTQADVAILGEGEKIINAVVKGNNHINGIAFRCGDKITVNPRNPPIEDLDYIHFPAWDLFPIEEYATNLKFTGAEPSDRTLAVITSRGCVNRCSFCYRMEEGIRLRSLDNLFEELKILTSDYGITYFYFADEMFLPSRSRIREMVSLLEKLNKPIKYFCMARTQLGRDKEVVKMLADSGCKIINYGLESLDQNVLNLMNKMVKVEDNYKAVETTIEAGIHPGLNFIWGNPGDTSESLQKIVDFLLAYDTFGQIRTIRPPTPYPGSPLYHQAIQEGKLKGPADFFEKFTNSDRLTVNFTNISDAEVHLNLFKANSILLENYFKKKGKPEEADTIIADFKRVYFPNNPDDLKFRGVRHYAKNSASLPL